MDIEKISIDTLLSENSLKRINGNGKKSSPRSFFRRGGKVKCVAGAILMLLAFSAILLLFLKNPLGGGSSSDTDTLINYNSHPYLKLTSPADPNIQWEVFADISENQVFLIRNLHPLADATRRLLVEDQDQTSITQVIQRKFKDDHLTIYHLFEGDFEHVHCFRIKDDFHSELIPLLKVSQFSEKSKISFDNFERSLFKSPESGLVAEIDTDLQGELLGLRMSGAPEIIGEDNESHSINGKRMSLMPEYKPDPIDPDTWLEPKLTSFRWQWPWSNPPNPPSPSPRPRPSPNPNPSPSPSPSPRPGPSPSPSPSPSLEPDINIIWPPLTPMLKPSRSSNLATKSPKVLKGIKTHFVSQVAKTFDIDIMKTKLNQAGKCFDYSLEFKKPESAYDSSKMKCSAGKINDSGQKSLETGATSIKVHGNWCGKNHGGFDNNCSAACNEDLWGITENCNKCWPAVDYTDQQCRAHDLCTNRHQILLWGSDGCDLADSKASVSTPCECNFYLQKELEEKKLVEGCKGNKDCLENGRVISEGIRAQPCGCEVNQCFEVPKVNKTNVGLENKCLKYDACLPTSICSRLS